MSKEKSESLLFEDLTVASNNALGVGDPSGMNLKPKKVSLFDLVKQAGEWEKEITKAPNRLPFPLSDGVSDDLSELYIAAADIQNKVAQAAKSSIISDNENAKKQVKKVYKRLSIIKAQVKKIVNDIDDMGIGTEADEFHA
tara:strand:- start:94 stop:516 length:423 start_codon:yes stop_codon:yes gene_type:complete